MDKRKPNILFVFPDQWRGDCLGFLNKHPVQTPFVDEVAENSTVFTRGYSVHPTCVPARASLLTGLTASSHGRLGYSDGIPWRYQNTLPELLRNGGYETLLTGKTHFFPPRIRLGFEQMRLYVNQVGEDFDNACDYQPWLKEKSNGTVSDPGVAVCSDNSWYARAWPGPEELHPNVWTTNEALHLLERRDATRPFFLQVGYHRPHPPFDPPGSILAEYADVEPNDPIIGEWAAEFAEPIEKALQAKVGILPPKLLAKFRRAYYAQLTAVDYEFGRLIWYLKRNHLFDNTIVVFCSDHGEALGDHHQFGKVTPFEPSISVPFFIKFPERFHTKAIVNEEALVTLIDVMPTLLDCADLPIPEFCEGQSLLPICQDPVANRGREALHGEHAPALRRSESWQFIVRQDDKYIWDSVSGREWYFDRKGDPNELTDQIDNAQFAAQIDECRTHLVNTLQHREADGLVENGQLKAGKAMPALRPELMTPRLDYDNKLRPRVKA